MKLSLNMFVGIILSLARLALSFDGELKGIVLGVEIGVQKTDFSGNGGIASSGHAYPAESKGVGFAWAADVGYSWSYFGVNAGYSRRYYKTTMWQDSSEGTPYRGDLNTILHFPSFGMNGVLTHGFLGTPKQARVVGEFGGLFVNEEEVFKTFGFGYSLGIGQEIFKYTFVEAKWMSGGRSGAERTFDLSSLQIMLRLSIF